jgi:single-strand DNA-binding protein
MARGENLVTLIGNATRDPEFRATANGHTFASLNLACETSDLVNGEQREQVDFVPVKVWGGMADKIIKPFVKKGARIAVVGRIRSSSWDDKETGEKRYGLEVNASRVLLLDSKHDAEDRSNARGAGGR